MTSSESGKNKQSATAKWAPQHSFPGGTKQPQGLGKLLRVGGWGGENDRTMTSRDRKWPVIVHSYQAFTGTFQLDLKSNSSPWALYVTKGKTDSQKGFLS